MYIHLFTATKQKILRPDDSENEQFGRKRPKMATLNYFTIYILSQGTLRKALAAEGRFAMFGYVYELNKV